MKSKPWLVLLCLLSVVALGACTGAKSDSNSAEIVIGEFGSLTGTTATFGISTKNGIDMAIDEVNKAGGVLGKKVRVIVEDDQGKPEEAQTVVTKADHQRSSDRGSGRSGILAHPGGGARRPAEQHSDDQSFFDESQSHEIGDYIFRVCFIDPFQGIVMAKFATNTLKVKNVAILRDIKNDYSVGFADVFVENFKKMGGNIVADESYSEGDTDFSAQLTSIKSKNPQAVFRSGLLHGSRSDRASGEEARAQRAISWAATDGTRRSSSRSAATR